MSKITNYLFVVDDEHVEFNVIKAFKFPFISVECHRIDVADSLL